MNINITATKAQIEALKESLVWKDICNELEVWSKGFNDEMMSIVTEAENSNLSTAAVLMHMGDLHGRQKTVEYLLALPDVLLDVLNAKSDQNSNKLGG